MTVLAFSTETVTHSLLGTLIYTWQTTKTFHSSIGDKSQVWLLSLENLRP